MGEVIAHNQTIQLTQNGKVYTYNMAAHTIILDSNNHIAAFKLNGVFYFAGGNDEKIKVAKWIKTIAANLGAGAGAMMGGGDSMKGQVAGGIVGAIIGWNIETIINHLPGSSQPFGYYNNGKRYFEKAVFVL